MPKLEDKVYFPSLSEFKLGSKNFNFNYEDMKEFITKITTFAPSIQKL